MSVLHYIGKKNVKLESIAKKALKNKDLLSELFEDILSKEDAIRFNNFKTLLLLSEDPPELLYPHWNYFQDLLSNNNNYQKLIAIRLIAILTRIDTENKFEKIFDEYYDMLKGERTMTAGHLTTTFGKIAKAKPKLQSRITNKQLNIDKIHHGKQ
ncbi:MAG: hypothetical protein JSW06_06715 [Thermoplasmatales archaeon]|nr:MAG: hypothetical protein JSW06_06715 [Thermoplasmatales archaeon]